MHLQRKTQSPVTMLHANDHKTNFEFTTDPGLQVDDQVRNSGNTIIGH